MIHQTFVPLPFDSRFLQAMYVLCRKFFILGSHEGGLKTPPKATGGGDPSSVTASLKAHGFQSHDWIRPDKTHRPGR